MGACASKFTVLKNASNAPPPAVEVESREVNPAEEVAVEKDDAAAVEDEASRRQSLGHLLSEGEEKKGSAESDGTEVKPEAVADDKTEKAPVVDGLKSKGLEEEILACQNVATEVETVKLETKVEVETLKTEKSENKAVEVPETLEVQPEKEGEKPAEATKCETSVKAPEAPETEKTEAVSDLEKKETDEKLTESTEIITPEKKPEVTEEQKKETSEAEKKNAEEKPIETSEKKPESPKIEKTEQKQATDTEKKEIEEKPAENTKVETSDKVEDKHVLEARTTETFSGEKTSEPASDAEKPKAEEEKAKS